MLTLQLQLSELGLAELSREMHSSSSTSLPADPLPSSANRTNPAIPVALGDPPDQKGPEMLISLDPVQQNPHWVHLTQIPLKSNIICSLQFHIGTELRVQKNIINVLLQVKSSWSSVQITSLIHGSRFLFAEGNNFA